MQGNDLAKMVAINSKCDRQREQTRTPQQRPEKEPPVMNALHAANPQLVYRTPKGQDILRLHLNPDFGRLILAQKGQNALVIELRGIDDSTAKRSFTAERAKNAEII